MTRKPWQLVRARAATPDTARGPIRIGVVLADLGPLKPAALKFLILHLNTLQRRVQYEFVPAPRDDALLSQLAPGCHNTWSVWQEGREALVERVRTAYLDGNTRGTLNEPPPEHFVVISLASTHEEYYYAHGERISLITMGDWKRFMAPPSLVEFILTLIIVEAVETASSLGRHPFHLGTKGCARDYNDDLRDTRYKALQGFFCEHCRGLLRTERKEYLADEFTPILEMKWLGKLDDPYSPARIAANLGYNLFTTKGVAPTLSETVRMKLGEETIKQVLQLSFALLLAALVLILGLKGR